MTITSRRNHGPRRPLATLATATAIAALLPTPPGVALRATATAQQEAPDPAAYTALEWRHIGPEGNRFSAAAGIVGPVYLGYLKDVYPDRAVMYCFLVGILMLGGGFLFCYLLTDNRIRLGRPTLEGTLREYGIPVPTRT